MSTTYIAAIVGILAVLLPHLGLTVGTDELTSWVSAVFVLASAVYVMYQRTTLQKAPGGFGDVSASGFRKN